MTLKIFLTVILLTAISLLVPLPGPFQSVCAFVQAFFLPGLVLVAFVGDIKSRDMAEVIVLSLLLSPILTTLLVLAGSEMTGTYTSGLRVGAMLPYIGLVAALFTGKFSSGFGKPTSLTRTAIMISVAYAGIVSLLYLYNGFLLIRSDAWYHASLVTEISTRGLPPMEPWLPAASIRYMWIYHLFLSSWKELSGMSLFPSMAFINILAAFSIPMLASLLTARLTRDRTSIKVVPLFTVAGLESVSWILWPMSLGRALFGEVRGLEEITRHLKYAAGQLDSYEVIYFLKPYGTWMVNISDKILTVTAFSYSLSLLLLALHLFSAFRDKEHGRYRVAILIAIVALGTFLFHVVTGVALLFTLVAAGTALPIMDRYKGNERRMPARWYLVPLAAIAAGAAVFPFFLSLGGGNSASGPGLPLHIGLKNILTIGIPLIILIKPLSTLIRRIAGAPSGAYHTFTAWIISLLILNIFIDLPTRNESKFIYPLFLVLGVPLYVEIVRWMRESGKNRRLLLSIALFVMFFAPQILTFRGFAMDRGEIPREIRRSSIDDLDSQAFEWMRCETPLNAVFAEAGTDHLASVYGERRLLFSDLGVINVLGYHGPQYESWRAVRDMLYSPEPLSEEDIDFIAGFGPNLYISVWSGDLGESPWLEDRFDSREDRFSKEFENDKLTVYRCIDQR